MEKIERFAWIFALLAFFTLVGAGSYYFVVREQDGTWTALVLVAGAFSSLWLFLDWPRLATVLRQRGSQHGIMGLLLIVIAACVGVSVNILAERVEKRWDLTREHRFTLADKSLAVLNGLDRDILVYAFFPQDSAAELAFEDLGSQLSAASPHIKVEYIDPNREPKKALDFKITNENGTIVLVSGDDRQRMETEFGQDAFINAITRLTSGKEHKVCWSIGHGELDPDDDQSPDGLGVVNLKLEDQNYTIVKRTIFVDGIAPDCTLEVIARPTTEFSAKERETIAAYVASGGRLLVTMEPTAVPEFSAYLGRFGIGVGDDVVIEMGRANQAMGVDPTYLVMAEAGQNFAMHPITEGLHGLILFGISRSVSDLSIPGLDATELTQTSSDAFAESNLDPNAPVEFTDGVDRQGRIPVAVAMAVVDPEALGVLAPGAPAPEADTDGDTDAALAPIALNTPVAAPVDDAAAGVPADFVAKPGGRVVVFGDTDFAGNTLVGEGNNGDLYLNAIAWLANEDAQLGEAAKDNSSERLVLTVVDEALLYLATMFLIPGLSVFTAAVVLIRRRFL